MDGSEDETPAILQGKYLIMYRMKIITAKLVEVLVDVLVWTVTADESAVNEPIRPSQL
jgi:hypothetical protein